MAAVVALVLAWAGLAALLAAWNVRRHALPLQHQPVTTSELALLFASFAFASLCTVLAVEGWR